ncbi:SAM-dependent methyltransferase [Frankia sp. AgPm24]|nr:SAM-dependent methyltransferase [Frankia sp. AgPm24]
MASSQSSGPGNRGPRSTANSAAEVRGTLDLSQPIGLSLFAILHFFPDTDRPLEILRQLLAILPAGGSYLALSHFTADHAPEEASRLISSYAQSGFALQARSVGEVGLFLRRLGTRRARRHLRPALAAQRRVTPGRCERQHSRRSRPKAIVRRPQALPGR